MPLSDAETASSPAMAPPEMAPEGWIERVLEREGKCLLATVAVCSAPLLIGFVVGYLLIASGWYPVDKEAKQKFEQDISKRLDMPWQDRFAAIAKPNFTCYAVFIVGVFTLGLEAVVHLGYLGVATGIAVAKLTSAGVPFGHVAALLLPHAIFELPGFLLAGSLGFRAGLMFLRYLRGRLLIMPGEVRRMSFVAAGSFGLLVAAAFVEAIVTPAMAALRGVGPFPH